MIPLVDKIACKYVNRTNASITYDDLYGEGCLGYMQAVKRFDPSVQENFDAFAQKRIQGAILDYLRKHKIVGNTRYINAISIEIADSHTVTESFENDLILDEMLEVMREALNTHKDPFTKHVANHHFKTNENMKATARECNTSQYLAKKAVNDMVKYARKLLNKKNQINA